MTQLGSLHFLLQPEHRANTPTHTGTCISTFAAATQDQAYKIVSPAEQADDTTTLTRQ